MYTYYNTIIITIISNYIFQPRRANLNGSGEPAHPPSLARTPNDSHTQGKGKPRQSTNHIQSNFNGSNIFGTMEIRSRHG